MTLTQVRPAPRAVRRDLRPLIVVAATMLVRLLLLVRLPLSPDEGGFLIVGGQWSPGRSLYGDYWVDRPPLLIGFFGLADDLGGKLALRLMGVVMVGIAVAASAVVGHLAAPVLLRRRTALLASLTAAVFLSTPLFGVGEVNGELLGATAVLVGLACYLTALRCSSRAALVLTGGLAAVACLLKQNEIDLVVLVLAGAVALPAGLRRRDALGWPALGALVVTVATLAWAATRGTTPADLWQAVVVFRFHASGVIASSATGSNHARLAGLVVALVTSGAPLVAAALVAALRARPAPGALDLRLPAVAVLAWESVSVLGGGSYWLHYLICFVPGLVLAAVVATVAVDRSPVLTRVALAYAGVAAAVSLAAYPPLAGPATPPLVAWLRAHTHPGESGVIAFGHADYLEEAGLVSPYSELWSLPVRVRDPRLAEFGTLLDSPSRPCVVVTDSNGLPGWGLDATRAVQVLDTHYRRAAVVDEYPVYVALSCSGRSGQ